MLLLIILSDFLSLFGVCLWYFCKLNFNFNCELHRSRIFSHNHRHGKDIRLSVKSLSNQQLIIFIANRGEINTKLISFHCSLKSAYSSRTNCKLIFSEKKQHGKKVGNDEGKKCHDDGGTHVAILGEAKKMFFILKIELFFVNSAAAHGSNFRSEFQY